MNENQLESCLKKLKSSSCEPDGFDEQIEARIRKEFHMLKSNRRRRNRIAVVLAVFVICGTGFVVAGGDETVMQLLSSPTVTDATGNPSEKSNSLWSKFISHIHDHLRKLHGHPAKNMDAK